MELICKVGILVIVFMGDVVVSGGYWILMNVDCIFVELNIIIGLIGIFGMYYLIFDMLVKFGV